MAEMNFPAAIKKIEKNFYDQFKKLRIGEKKFGNGDEFCCSWGRRLHPRWVWDVDFICSLKRKHQTYIKIQILRIFFSDLLFSEIESRGREREREPEE